MSHDPHAPYPSYPVPPPHIPSWSVSAPPHPWPMDDDLDEEPAAHARDGDAPGRRDKDLPTRPLRRASPHSARGHHGDLRMLRRAYRRQRRVATLAALGYFVVFLLLSAYEPSVLTRPVTGGLSTGLLLGLVQVPVTWLAVVLYECTARRYVDPLAARVRRHAPPDPPPRAPDHDGLVEPGR
ncbi:DUF485 domain-containing protein [Streptomyces sp. B3I8]|uniref:DUF485 domain-containing protein n=1 Tax=Streptomyces sp. B3I8 TaxID=3042303 RepID=UPI0027871F0A|nr:DUF485 domain-containing protein [Streptomyces sp. B3I8]MDQ0791027.1 uncharacterized membrane protein (DUF485 family) [Streptomyces sp. B3I8]